MKTFKAGYINVNTDLIDVRSMSVFASNAVVCVDELSEDLKTADNLNNLFFLTTLYNGYKENTFYKLTKQLQFTSLEDDGTYAPPGKVKYKTSLDQVEWLEDDAIIENGIFVGFEHKTDAVEVVLPAQDSAGNMITVIGSSVFSNCTNLVVVTIPSTISTVGNSIFYNCSSLNEVRSEEMINQLDGQLYTVLNFNTASELFRNCNNLQGNYCFASATSWPCKYGKESQLPMCYASKIARLTLPNLNNFGDSPDSAFKGMTSLEYLHIPNIAACNSEFGFRYCGEDREIIIDFRGRSLNYVPELASSFFNVSSVSKVNPVIYVDVLQYTMWMESKDWRNYPIIPMPESEDGKVLYKTSIDGSWLEAAADVRNGSFFGFQNMDSAVVALLPEKDYAGNDILELYKGVFRGKTNLKYIILPKQLTKFNGTAFMSAAALEEIVIPAGVEDLNTEAFYNCSSLKKLVFAGSNISVLNWRFCANCTSLKEIDIPKSVTTIGSWAFGTCTSLSSVVINSDLELIDDYAFRRCTSLQSIVFNGNAPQTVKAGVFINVPSTCVVRISRDASGFDVVDGKWQGLQIEYID